MWRPQVYLALVACVSLLTLLDARFSKCLPDLFRTFPALWFIHKVFVFSLVGAAYFAIRCSVRNGRHHFANLLLLVCCIAVTAALTWTFLTSYRAATTVFTTSYKDDAEALQRYIVLSNDLVHEGWPEQRLDFARYLYHSIGLKAAYSDAQGQITVFSPTPDDDAEFAATKDSRQAARERRDLLETELSKMPGAGLETLLWFSGALLLYFAGDLARDAWLRSKGKQVR